MTGIRRALPPVMLVAAALACAFALERSLACPIQSPPQPLRMLYKQSERVVVARVGAKEVLSTEDDVASVRIALHVTENVKGAPIKVIHFYHDEYVGEDAKKDDEEVSDEVRISVFSGRPIPILKRGERYLFFLDPREEDEGYEIGDEGYGIKKLSDEDLKVYLERMKELADITRQEPENKHALVEWLVRCAEETATRWEGAYELAESAEAAARGDEAQEQVEAEAVQTEAVEEEPAAPAGGEAQAAPEPQASASTFVAPTVDPSIDVPVPTEIPIQRLPFGGDRYTPPDPTLAPMLNAVQKQRLSDALIASSEPGEGEDFLILLVKDFGDPRFPGFVLARLHRFEDEAPLEAELWLRALAASLKNEQIKKLADSYSENTAYYDMDEEEETEAATQTEAAAESNDAAQNEEAASEEVEETPEDLEAQAARAEAATERATLKRSAMLKALLARIDLFVATGQLAEARP